VVVLAIEAPGDVFIMPLPEWANTSMHTIMSARRQPERRKRKEILKSFTYPRIRMLSIFIFSN
jgi:hypothetical protein